MSSGLPFSFFSPCFTLRVKKSRETFETDRLCLLKNNIAETNTADQPSITAK